MLSELYEVDVKLMDATFRAIWAYSSAGIYMKAIKCTQGLKKKKKPLALTARNCVQSMTSSLL